MKGLKEGGSCVGSFTHTKKDLRFKISSGEPTLYKVIPKDSIALVKVNTDDEFIVQIHPDTEIRFTSSEQVLKYLSE